jgi:hypothetical protein
LANASIVSRKRNLLTWIEGLHDLAILKKLENIKEGVEEEIDNFCLPGAPMSVEELKQRVMSAHEEVANGQFITHEDLKREMDTW